MSVVDIFFTLLNFGILVAGSIYVFKKWILPRISDEILQRKEELEGFVNRQEMLNNRLIAIEVEREDREKWYQDLAQKVVLWRDATLRQKQFEQEERLRDSHLIRERNEKQLSLRTMQRVQARVIPHAVAQARLELYDYYQSGEEGTAFVEDMVVSLRNRHGRTE